MTQEGYHRTVHFIALALPSCSEFNLSPSFLSTALLSPLLLSISYRTLTLLPYMTVQEDEIIATVV